MTTLHIPIVPANGYGTHAGFLPGVTAKRSSMSASHRRLYWQSLFFDPYGQLLVQGMSKEVKDRDVRIMLVNQSPPIHGIDRGTTVLDMGNPAEYRAGVSNLRSTRSLDDH